MDKVVLKIESSYESKSVTLEDELSIGRTDQAGIRLSDVGLSRVNTTIFRDGEDVLVVDEGSSNGTFLNGEKLGREPKLLLDGDELSLGSETRIKVTIGEAGAAEIKSASVIQTKRVSDVPSTPTVQNVRPDKNIEESDESEGIPKVLIVAAGSAFLIIFFALIAILIANYLDLGSTTTGGRPTPRSNPNAAIPIRVIDPLGGQKQEDLNELAQYWEVQDDVKTEDLADITGSTKTASKLEDFNVSVAFYETQKAKAYERRNSPIGNDPPGTKVPRELFGDGVIKQKAKIREMKREGYQLPMDFADLARKRMAGELVELPMATDYWILQVGGSSTTAPFTSFNFDDHIKAPLTPPGADDYSIISQLAANFSGTQYSMINPDHRKQMKIRLLRMFHPRARPILEELAKAYHAKFNRPLRVTSLSRSMQYQIGLNKFNPNSFRVRGKGSLPPHTSGCAFDLARKHMTAEEQNFMMAKLAEMEKRGVLDALREGNLNACFHVFIYDDGTPPKM